MTTPSAVLDRLALVLSAFDGRGRLNLANVVRYTGLPRSSAHRMLERLAEANWVRREGNEYELGSLLIHLGSLAIHQHSLRRSAAPIIRDLHRATGYVVHLGILEGTHLLYLDTVGGRLAGSMPTRIGLRYPAHRTAMGKALMASSQSDDDCRGLTPELRKIRENGVAYEISQAGGGIASIAVPIGPAGETVGALSVCGRIRDMKLDHRHAAPVRMAANAIFRTVQRDRLRGPSSEDRGNRPENRAPTGSRRRFHFA
ncbi:IclR family transcriptional regulator [Rhodococcus sp. ACT016]|uniref:IclR family transcriptional regulator n=1 Tax=Rhodococcus sp. ACT016 TaxID=3134808 RepID=UPI003D2A04B8